MSNRTGGKVQAQQKTLSGSSSKSSLLQRTCECGQHMIAGGECEECRKKQEGTLQRSQRAFEPPSAPGTVQGNAPAQENGTSFNSAFDRASRFGHDFSQIPIRPPAAGVIQTKLAINKPGDEYEQEADRIADQVLAASPNPAVRGAAPGIQGFSGQTNGPMDAAPASVNQALASPGRPLELALRQDMEQRFGYDFSQVRVHTGAAAEQSAGDVNAHAYTVGHNLVFGAGRYAPGTHKGRRLLAHELMHVVQQTAQSGTMPGLFRKKAKTHTLWFQEAVDRLKVVEKRQIIPQEGLMLRKFMALVEAVDAENAAAVPKLLADFISGDPYSLPPLFPSDSLANELITRMMLLGLNAESAQFRTWQLHQPRLKRTIQVEVYLWEGVLERLTGRIPAKDADAAVKILDALALLFDQLRNEAISPDKKAIQADIYKLLRMTFAGIQTAYQLVLDQAIADLGAGKGAKYLQVAKDTLQKLIRLVEPADQLKQAGGVTLPVTRSEFKKGGGRHLDIFLKGKAAEKRSVKISFYDVEMEVDDAMEKQMDFGRILAIRRHQCQVLERLYGLEKDKSGKPTEETKENVAAIAKLGKAGFHLDSDDDWRKFLLEKFEAHRAAHGKAEALTAVIKLLETYLRAFTTHTPYNIDDFGDNLLTKTFPRALTGQLIHDCGVYALRIAYMLSLLREHPDLQLRFHYIVLPVHIGLIITGKDLPLYIAHNDQFTIYSAADVAELKEEWRHTDPEGKPRAPSRKDETKQFLGELAGTEFIPGTDLPFKILDVPHLKGSPAAMKRQLWQFYKTKSQTKLFGPKTKDPQSPHFQFHLRYLKVLEMMRVHFNTKLVPFWNVKAHNAWLAHGPDLIRAWQQLQSAKPGQEKSEAQSRYDDLAQRYKKIIDAGLQEVDTAFSPITTAQLEIGQYLKEHPEVIAKDIPITHSERLETVFGTDGQWWERTVQKHLLDILARLQKPDAPFARDQDLLELID